MYLHICNPQITFLVIKSFLLYYNCHVITNIALVLYLKKIKTTVKS